MPPTIKLYASLIGPLLGVYYPLPNLEEFDTADEKAVDRLDYTLHRVALNTSRLSKLWCAIYTSAEVDQQCEDWGGVKLGTSYANMLDYDYNAVAEAAKPRVY